MFSLMSSNAACLRAAQLFVTIVAILAIGKAITWVPVMYQLDVAGYFKAAEIVWFFARLAALVMFYFFAGYLIDALPDRGGVLSFARAVAEPLTALLIVITVQALLWEILAPFVDALGRTIYFSAAISLIVGVSIWLVLRAYHHATYLVETAAKLLGLLSGLFPGLKSTCPQCQAEVAVGVHFCDHCGYKIRVARECAKCGAALADAQKFCPQCGEAVSQTTAATPDATE